MLQNCVRARFIVVQINWKWTLNPILSVFLSIVRNEITKRNSLDVFVFFLFGNASNCKCWDRKTGRRRERERNLNSINNNKDDNNDQKERDKIDHQLVFMLLFGCRNKSSIFSVSLPFKSWFKWRQRNWERVSARSLKENSIEIVHLKL